MPVLAGGPGFLPRETAVMPAWFPRPLWHPGPARVATYHRRMTQPSPPPEVQEAASRRSEARVARDWATADRLRDEIEAAGWRVVDAGTRYRLELASPPDVEVGGEIRYGRSDAVPSLLDAPAAGLATVVIVATPDAGETLASLDGAIVVDRDSCLLAAGAILRHPPTEQLETGSIIEGARTTAAMAASKFGPVLKVSEDGDITFFDRERIWDI